MKCQLLNCVLFLLLHLPVFAVANGTTDSASKEVVVISDVFMPYINHAESVSKGIAIDLMTSILKDHHMTLVHKTTTWEGMLKAYREEKSDCIPIVSAETITNFKLPVPKQDLISLKQVLIGLKATKGLPTKPSDFSKKTYRIGSIEGYQIPERIIKTLPGTHISKTFSTDNPASELLQQLNAGKIDLAISYLFVTRFESKKMGLEKNIKFLMEFKDFEQKQFISCRDPKIQKIIDEGIIKARASGLFLALINRYI